MIEFSLAYALAVIFFSAFVPGAIASLAIFRKSDFSILEKILIGFAFGWIVQGFLPFAEFTILGVKFSYVLALINTGIFYALAIGLFAYFKAHEEIKLHFDMKEPLKYAVPAFVLLIFVLNFWVRIQSLSPIFQELDPYYYLYVTQQIITEGYNPFDDKTAWYPEESVHHRAAPLPHYMEATWYVFYSQQYDNHILSLVANIYPPLAAAFTAFFLYLGLRAWFRPEYAAIASAIASFVPIFIMKLMAGEAEIQGYAFFSIAMFIGFFLWAHRKHSMLYSAFAGMGYFAVSTGSSSEVVVATVFLLFTVLQSLTLFILKKDMEQFLKVNATFIAFVLLGAVLKSAFYGTMIISYAAAGAAAVGLSALLFFLQKAKLDPEMQTYALGGLVFAGIIALAFTPVGGIIRGVALTGLQIAEYTLPLHRTIAEQGTSGAVFEPSLGFIGKIFDDGIYVPIGYLFAIPSAVGNLSFSLFSAMLNALLGTNLDYNEKENSILMAFFFFFFLASAYSAYKMIVKKEETPLWFFIALIFPIALVGLIKAKYVIYLGFVIAAGIAFVFAELEMMIIEATKIAEANRKQVFYAFLAIGMLTATMQFAESTAPAMIKAGFGTRFQDNPLALKELFSDLCDRVRMTGNYDPDICEAGNDPIGYANASINNQYNYRLCFLSLIEDPFNQGGGDDRVGAAYRCERVSDYWLDSMEWIRYNTENGSRITSWWDYGHWENWFGQRNAVIRNEHVSHDMIVEIAHDYISGTPAELKEDMLRYDSKYALFDSELLMSGNSFGGKYGALNYLACARNNETDVSKSPGMSACEAEHLWEQIYAPASPTAQEQCTISYNKKGINAYVLKPVDTGRGLSYELSLRYCVGQATLATGQNVSALYDLNERSPDGTLKLHKAFLKYDSSTQNNMWNVYTLFYTKDQVWVENGNVTSGWGDRVNKFYDSNLYNAFVLEELPGFEMVYKTPGGEVKIFRIKES